MIDYHPVLLYFQSDEFFVRIGKRIALQQLHSQLLGIADLHHQILQHYFITTIHCYLLLFLLQVEVSGRQLRIFVDYLVAREIPLHLFDLFSIQFELNFRHECIRGFGLLLPAGFHLRYSLDLLHQFPIHLLVIKDQKHTLFGCILS